MVVNEAKLLKILKKDHAIYEKTYSSYVVGNTFGFYHLPELSPKVKGKLIELGFNLETEKLQILRENGLITENNDGIKKFLDIPEGETSVKLTKLIYQSSKKHDNKYLLVAESGEICAINTELLDPALSQPGELAGVITAQCKEIEGKVMHLRLILDDHTLAILLPVLHLEGGWTKEIKEMIAAPTAEVNA